MKRCAFLTMEDTAGWSIDADLAFEPMSELGWRSDWVPWTRPGIDWGRFDAAYLAATWDYPDEPARFLDVLAAIDRSAAILVNPLDIVRWNIPKTYLRDLDAAGACIVPSLWFERFADCDLDAAFTHFDCDRIIVKPVVSTNANNTFLLDRRGASVARASLGEIFRARPFVVQRFLEAVVDEGEYSLFLIGDGFSHAISKRPKAGDFRVQEEHGASIEAVALTDELLAAAGTAMAGVPERPLYGRCDLVRDRSGELCVMELELIEPSLYLRMNDGAPARFASAFDEYIARARG
jgi:glutathione synthase/RimK-type ligase-like ATP-grasp enzyme